MSCYGTKAIEAEAIRDREADELQCISRYIERILLRILFGVGTRGREGIVALVIEVPVVPVENGLLCGIGKLHTAKGFTELTHAIVIDGVSDESLRSRGYLRAIKENPHISADIIDTTLRDDLPRVRLDEGLPLIATDTSMGIVEEMLRRHCRLVVDELDIVSELSIIRSRDELPVV